MATFVFTIAGSAKAVQPGWSINATANGRDVLTCDLLSVLGSYRPALDAEVLVTENGTRIFGGWITDPDEHGLEGARGAVPIVTTVTVGDFNAFADHRIVSETIPIGTLKAALQILVTYLSAAPYSVILHASQVTGPTLPALVYDDVPLVDVLNDLTQLTGYTWEIDYNKNLRMSAPGTVAAPFNVVTGNGIAIGDISVVHTRQGYTNRAIARAKTATVLVSHEQHLGNGVLRTWQLDDIVSSLDPYVYLYDGGVSIGSFPVGVYGTDDFPWTFDAATNSLIQRADQTVLSGAGYLTMSYQKAMIAIVENTGEQTARGIWDTVIVVDTIYLATLQAFANAYLIAHTPTMRTVRFNTYAIGFAPGQTLTINVAARGINTTFLITEVQTRNNAANLVIRTVTATEGTVYHPELAWRDVYKQWASGGGASGGSTFVGVGGVTSGGTGSGRTAHYLGGSAIEMVSSGAPAWVAASAVQVYLNSVTRGSVDVLVTCRVRANAGSVTARLRNLSDGLTVGTSAVATSTTFVTMIFPGTLTAGNKLYQIELLGTTANTPLAAVSYLE